MKVSHIATALVVGALCTPAAMAKSKGGVRVKSGSIHATTKGKKATMSKLGRKTIGKVRKPRKPAKPVFQPGPGAGL